MEKDHREDPRQEGKIWLKKTWNHLAEAYTGKKYQRIKKDEKLGMKWNGHKSTNNRGLWTMVKF